MNHTIEINGSNLFYIDIGTGTPLIFLHGNGEDHTIFNASISFFQNKFRVIAIDSRGHGQSTLGNKPLSIPLLSSDIVDFINLFKLNDVILVGFSDGGNAALEVASTIQDKISKIIVVGSNTKFCGLK